MYDIDDRPKRKTNILSIFVHIIIICFGLVIICGIGVGLWYGSSYFERSKWEPKYNESRLENEELQSKYCNVLAEKIRLEIEVNELELEDVKFAFYYAPLTQQRFGVDDLEEYLDRWQWTEGTYVAGQFDCSEMSAYLEWRLENEGYNTIIVAGDSPFGTGRHAWLLVETSAGQYMPVEATTYSVVLWSSVDFDNYFIYEESFETIHEALEYSATEFDWWN